MIRYPAVEALIEKYATFRCVECVLTSDRRLGAANAAYAKPASAASISIRGSP